MMTARSRPTRGPGRRCVPALITRPAHRVGRLAVAGRPPPMVLRSIRPGSTTPTWPEPPAGPCQEQPIEDRRTCPDELRPITFSERDYTAYAQGSVLVSCGDTKVLCTAMVDDDVPAGCATHRQGGSPPSTRCCRARRGSGSAETRAPKAAQEIQRLIDRALRSVCDMKALGERQILIDCDVLQADGGTHRRSAAPTWRCTTASPGWYPGPACCPSAALRRLAVRSPSVWWTASRCSTSRTQRTRPPRPT